jgi:hypothetical protein
MIVCISSAPVAILTKNMIFMIHVYLSMLQPLQYVQPITQLSSADSTEAKLAYVIRDWAQDDTGCRT